MAPQQPAPAGTGEDAAVVAPTQRDSDHRLDEKEDDDDDVDVEDDALQDAQTARKSVLGTVQNAAVVASAQCDSNHREEEEEEEDDAPQDAQTLGTPLRAMKAEAGASRERMFQYRLY